MKHNYSPQPLPRRLLGVVVLVSLALALAGLDSIASKPGFTFSNSFLRLLTMNLTDTSYEVHCANVAEKQSLFDYAAKCGVPFMPRVGASLPAYRDDEDLAITYCKTSYAEGLMSVFVEADRPADYTQEQFCKMCDAYAASH